MNERKDEYYQPWLRDDPATDADRSPPPDGGLAKPMQEPPVGIDIGRYPSVEEPARAPLVRPQEIKAGMHGLGRKLKDGAVAFADWTIDIGARADVPARVAALEIPRRAREAAQKSGAATARGAGAVGAGAARAGRGAAAASGSLWRKMALGDKVSRLSDEAGRGLGEVADKTKSGIGKVAKAGKDSIGEAATKLRPAPRPEPEAPPSGLEQLLAREQAEAQKAEPVTTPDLPLFAAEPASSEPLAPVTADLQGDDRSPVMQPPAPKRETSKAMAASPPPQRTGTVPLPVGAPVWAIAVGSVALLAAAFWLGGRFGGGMGKGEVEAIVADYIRANPQIIPEALEAQRDRETAKAIDAVRPALEKPYAGAWIGNADGDVTLVVFSDYACGFCRASLPDIDRLVREDKRLKVVFRELPIISPQSRDAALMSLAAARQGKYDAFHHAMFASPSLDAAGIAAAAEKAGVVTDGSADATANEALFQRELDSNIAIATQLQVNATPTWVVGDQMLAGQLGYDVLKRAIADARAKS